MTDIPAPEIVTGIVSDAAQRQLMPRFAHVERHRKADGSIVTAADSAMQQDLEQTLKTRWPAFEFLGEEMPLEQQKALITSGAAAFWCLDPLDGTSNFAAGIPFFGVSLALLVNGKPILGIIHDPVRGETFSAVKGDGARLNGRPCAARVECPELGQAIAGVDFKRLSAGLARCLVDEPPYGSQRNFGSCALEWGWIAAGRLHVYLHGGQRLWDFAAGSLILAEARGYSQTLSGETVFQQDLTPRSVVASGSKRLFGLWCRWLATRSR